MTRRRKKVSKLRWIIRILLLLVVTAIVIIGMGITYFLGKFSQVEIEEIKAEELMMNIEIEESVDFGEGYLNVAIFGVDSRDGELGEGTLSDTIIIASLNNETKEVKLVSVYRDTYLNLSDGTYSKCNAAYSYGGATMAINMLNTNLDMNIEKYVTVDFTVITDIVDAIGGIEIEIDESEIDAVNEYIAETAKVAGKEGVEITESGLQVLDGVQATTYARIRSTTGGDFKRTDRQRYVIEQIVKKVKTCNLATISTLIDEVLPNVLTNFTATEIAFYAASYLDIELGATMGFPEIVTTGTIPGVGSSVIPVTLESNVISLHEFLFPDLEYEPSETVYANSSVITSRTSWYGTGTANSNTSYETFSENSITNELLETDEENLEGAVEDFTDAENLDTEEVEKETQNTGKFNNPILEFNE